MDRRRILMVAAAVVAALGATLVFLYARGAENRAQEQFDTAQVLVAVQQIGAGESVESALATGKIAEQSVTVSSVLPGAVTSRGAVDKTKVALTTIYPGEQLLPAKFGDATAVEATSTLPIPEGMIAITIDLADPQRVAGFVNPGSEVSMFWSGINPQNGQSSTRMLHERILVLGTGSTTQVTTTTTTAEGGAQTVEQLPRTLLTLAMTQKQAERTIFADSNGEIAFGLLTDSSEVSSDTGVSLENLFK